MAKPKEKGTARRKGIQPTLEDTQGLIKSFSQENLLLFLVSLLVIIGGHIALGMGSVTVAPVALVLGYCILVPLAIII
ncbi:MAG: hypothetical protein JXQ83_15290 [Candidatus Glassbacteria bacterium]|nr:hypothetical protein [Candidatus Glassbacteria bacterium]